MKEIDSIVPVDEEHRLRLERTKANRQKLRERHQAEDAVERLDMEIVREGMANTRELAQLRIELNKEIQNAYFDSLARQTDLLSRIVRKLKGL